MSTPNERALCDLSAEMAFRGRMQHCWLAHALPDDPTECPLCNKKMTVAQLEKHGPNCTEADLRHVTFDVSYQEEL